MYDKNTFITLFQSVEYVKDYLYHKYKAEDFSNPVELAYQNGFSFVYYIKMGDNFFKQGKEAPVSIKPMLYFYGLSHWLKGLILTLDPHYPSTTQVLAHGVSTRKRKKQSYRFLSDEVKVQKHGFFPFVSKTVFNLNQLSGEKYKMRHLLMSIPEMNSLFQELEKETPLLPVSKEDNTLVVSSLLLKKLHLTEETFESMILSKTGVELSCILNEDLLIKVNNDDMENIPIYSAMDQSLFIPSVLPLYSKLPEIFAHFLLLYNLSMICRYETEWWGEVLYSFTSNDKPFIEFFLQITEEKTPWLLQRMFFSEKY